MVEAASTLTAWDWEEPPVDPLAGPNAAVTNTGEAEAEKAVSHVATGYEDETLNPWQFAIATYPV
ncbi:MAG: hypothetical protein M3076_07820 [Actinomycetota bacterium]|nr:hypothetical protein [Actinomycetota bacterium]